MDGYVDTCFGGWGTGGLMDGWVGGYMVGWVDGYKAREAGQTANGTT